MKQFLFILAIIATVIAPANVGAKTAPARKPAQADNHLAAPGDAKQATEAEIEKTLQQKAEDELLVGSWRIKGFDCGGNLRNRINSEIITDAGKEVASLVGILGDVMTEKISRDEQGKLISVRDGLSFDTLSNLKINVSNKNSLGHSRCRIQHVSEVSLDRTTNHMRYIAPVKVRCHPDCNPEECEELRRRKVLADKPWIDPKESLLGLDAATDMYVDQRSSSPVFITGPINGKMFRELRDNRDPMSMRLFPCRNIKTGEEAILGAGFAVERM